MAQDTRPWPALQEGAEILRGKPVWPMQVCLCALACSQKGSQGFIRRRGRSALPPVAPDGTLGHAICPTHHQDAAYDSLAEEHAPEHFDWKNQNPAPPREGAARRRQNHHLALG